MTAYPTDVPDSWEGPEWAAPERAERWLHRPERRTGAADFPLRAYAHRFIEGPGYQEMRRIEARLDRLDWGGVGDDWSKL